MVSGWRYYWRRYLGWLPVQFCVICGRPYWGGFPYPSLDQIRAGHFWQWLPWWSDYCSQRCAEDDLESLSIW